MNRSAHLSLTLHTGISIFIQLDLEVMCIYFGHLESSYCDSVCCWTFNGLDVVPVFLLLRGQVCESYNKVEMLIDVRLEYSYRGYKLACVFKLFSSQMLQRKPLNKPWNDTASSLRSLSWILHFFYSRSMY